MAEGGAGPVLGHRAATLTPGALARDAAQNQRRTTQPRRITPALPGARRANGSSKVKNSAKKTVEVVKY